MGLFLVLQTTLQDGSFEIILIDVVLEWFRIIKWDIKSYISDTNRNTIYLSTYCSQNGRSY